ncbi:MAG: 16S rRNA (cytidine(1402)-2'-O)-methyltransferase [Magnetococcales bacterium]|nr:16S rRNA (cytidine(1402)-2'-O)-methyltransferase [Magnetococcales bacterium]
MNIPTKAGLQLETVTGTLYIVPTPIGNLEDMTVRAVRVLKSVSCILAEDTRLSGILCRHYDIATRRMSLTEHNSPMRIPWILEQLRDGSSIALVSDAGSPGISDPGGPLIREVVLASLPLTVLPGPSAVTTALIGSGFLIDRFVFEGFLPRKGRVRSAMIQAFHSEERTILLFESPVRLCATLKDLAAVLGPGRRAVVARELTKIHESWHRGSLGDLAVFFEEFPPRGEMVIVIEGADAVKPTLDAASVADQIAVALKSGMKVKETARLVAAQTGLPASQIYQLALRLKSTS